MSRIILTVVCVLLFSSCVRERVIEVEREFNWSAHSDFTFDNQLQMNSRVSGDLMFFLGHTYFTCITADGSGHPDLDGQSAVLYNLWLTPPTNQKLPIGKDFFVIYNGNGYVRFFPNLNPVLNGAGFQMRINEMDEDFRFISDSYYSRGETIVINDRNQVLIPYSDQTTEVRMLLADISYEPEHPQNRHNLDTSVHKSSASMNLLKMWSSP